MSLEVSFRAADGREVTFDFDAWLAGSGDIDRDMDEAAAKIAWAGAMLGLLCEAEEATDAEYRAWRADEGELLLSGNEKLGEWKVKQLVEHAPDFVRYQRKLAELHRCMRTVETVVRALAAQADALRSRGANRRAEMRATGMSTPADDPEERSRSETEERDRKMREMYRSRAT